MLKWKKENILHQLTLKIHKMHFFVPLFCPLTWLIFLPEYVAFMATGRETSLWESCCLRPLSENTFRSVSKKLPSEV